MSNKLSQEEITRIEKEAREANPMINFLPIDASFHAGYLAGALHEAERGREMERARFIDFLQWLSAEKVEYSILYGGEPERFCDIDHDYTSEQISDLYILETLKRKE